LEENKMKKNNNTDRYCPYCHQKEVVFKKIYKIREKLIHSNNMFFVCQNPKCVFFIKIEINKLITGAGIIPFYYVKTSLW
jgi:hypothetical protein